MTLRPNKQSTSESALLQQAAQEAVRRGEAKPYVRSKAIPVTLAPGSPVLVPHGLKRKPVGWLFHSVLSTGLPSVQSAPDTVNIGVSCAAAGSCVIEVW